MIDYRRRLLATVGPLGIFVVAALLWYSWHISSTVPVSIYVLPTYANTTLNGKSIPNRTTQRLKPGTYTIAITAEEFKPLETTITIRAKEHFDFPLVPSSDIGRQWVEENSNLYSKVEERGGQVSLEKGLELVQKQPIIDMLPYSEDDGVFRIGYMTPDGTAESFQLTIYGSSAFARQLALSQIRSWGYDPADYDVRFMNFTNPLGEGE